MPFSLTEYKFGQYRGLMIYHPEKKHHIDILPGHGALIARLELFGHELTEPIENANQLADDHAYRNFWLIPFQNRVADGKYTIDDKSFQLAINETERNNALHGFFNEVELKEVSWDVAETSVSVEMQFNYTGQVMGYPFPFAVDMIYKIHEEGTVEMEYHFKNTGNNKLPFTVGWHPYFKLDGERADWQITIGDLMQHPLGERNLPEGDPLLFKSGINLATDQLDHCFEFAEKPYLTTLSTNKMSLSINQSDSLPFIQIFTPPRNSIALEPVSSGVDAFNTGVGIQVIEPDESVSGKIAISLIIK